MNCASPHAFPADEFAFFCFAYGDGLRIVEKAEYDDRVENIAMNEPEDCNVCRTMTDAEREMAFNETTQDDEGWSCTACHSKSCERAESIVDQDWHVGTANELAIRDELRRHWDAFALLFNPAINSFSDGFSRVR